MKRIFCILAVCAIVILAAGVSFGQGSLQGVANISCSAATDQGGNPICETDYYTPCCSQLSWTMNFYRTSNDASYGSLRLEIIGTDVARNFYKQNYAQGYHTETGTDDVNLNAQGKITVDFYGSSTGLFTDISASARYSTPNAE